MSNPKADILFKVFDVDGNGVVTIDDYRQRATRLLEAYGVDADSSQGGAIVEGEVGVWTGVAAVADVDKDGQVSREEFTKWFEAKVTNDDGFDEIMTPVLQARFALADTDGNGVLNNDEFVRFNVALGSAPPKAAEAFALVDADGDGQISVDEYVTALKGFSAGGEPAVVELLHYRN